MHFQLVYGGLAINALLKVSISSLYKVVFAIDALLKDVSCRHFQLAYDGLSIDALLKMSHVCICSLYNYRMAQTMQWLPAILDYKKKGEVEHINVFSLAS